MSQTSEILFTRLIPKVRQAVENKVEELYGQKPLESIRNWAVEDSDEAQYDEAENAETVLFLDCIDPSFFGDASWMFHEHLIKLSARWNSQKHRVNLNIQLQYQFSNGQRGTCVWRFYTHTYGNTWTPIV